MWLVEVALLTPREHRCCLSRGLGGTSDRSLIAGIGLLDL